MKSIELEEDEFSLSDVVANLLDNWKLFIVSVVVCVVLAFLYLKYATPQYKVHAKLLVEDQKNGATSIFSSTSAIASDFSDLFNIQSSVDNEAEILQTRDLMERVVRALNLNIVYLKKEQLSTIELFGDNPYEVRILNMRDSLGVGSFSIMRQKDDQFLVKNDDLELSVTGKFGDTIKTSQGQFIITKTGRPIEDKDYTFKITTIDNAVSAYMDALTVEVTSVKVSTINLTFNSNIPEKGEAVISSLIREYLNSNVQEKNKFADSTIAFIDERLAIVNTELSGVESSVQAFKQRNNIANLDAQSNQVITNASDYYNQLNQLDVQLEMTKTMLNYLSDQSNNNRPVPALTGSPDPTFAVLIQRYNLLQAQRDRLSLNNTEINPYIQNVDEQIQSVRKDLYNNLLNQQKNLQIARAKMAAQNNTVASTIKKVPEQERQFLDLSRQQDIKQALFLYLLQKKEEVEVSKASNIASARVIDHPKSEVRPFTPNKPLIFGAGLILGLALPFGFLYIRDLLNNRVNSREEIEKTTRVPVLAEISHNDTGETIIMKQDARTPLSEQFRALRTNLQFFVNGDKNNVILFTSSMSGEGKSFVALNLAVALAISGKKVMLMELDLRKPHITVHLDVRRDIGFTNYIISSASSVKDITQPSKLHENLDVIGAGPLPPNPAEMLLNPKMDKLMQELQQTYDYIIIDAPPVGVVTDAQLLSKYTDFTIYLVRQKYTLKKQLNIPEDINRFKKMNKIALLINDIQGSKRYGYGYGYGYEVSDNKKSNTNRKSKVKQ